MPIRTKTPTGCCAPVLAGRLGAPEAAELAALFRALGDPGRLRLISFLAAQPGGEACVCNLTEPLGLSQPTVSHHLKVLLEAGLVEREQRGRWAYFSLKRDAVEKLAAVADLKEACC